MEPPPQPSSRGLPGSLRACRLLSGVVDLRLDQGIQLLWITTAMSSAWQAPMRVLFEIPCGVDNLLDEGRRASIRLSAGEPSIGCQPATDWIEIGIACILQASVSLAGDWMWIG